MTRMAPKKWIASMKGKFFGAGPILLMMALTCTSGSMKAWGQETAQTKADAPAKVDVAALWRQVFDRAEPQAIYDTFGLIGKLEPHGTADAESCKANAQAIEDALKVNTVGLAMWYAAYRCAQVVGDEAAATKRLAMFSTLVRYTMESTPADFVETPMRVLSELDVQAFVRASGQELLYAFYDPPTIGRYLAINISLWDPERKRERLLRFDYLDNRMRMLRGEPLSEFPAFRLGVARSFIEAFGKNEGAWAAETLQLQKSFAGDSPAARMGQLENAAREGNFVAALVYSNACPLTRLDGCAAKSVDLMLPFAEKSYSMALITLALAYDGGVGVKRSPENAKRLIEAADRRLGDDRGSVLFAALSVWQGSAGLERSALAKQIVEALAERRNPKAELLVATAAASKTKEVKSLDAKYLGYLGDAAQAGLPIAQTMLGSRLVAEGKTQDGFRWIEHAASLNDATAQHALAMAYETGTNKEKNPDLARKWYIEAGQGGDVSSMQWMAHYYAGLPASPKTRLGQVGWLESAMDMGSVESALELAALYQSGGEGISGNEKNAAAIYRSLDKNRNNAEARRRLAWILTRSKVVDHDPAEARRLLQMDVDRGDMRSRVELGELTAAGDFGKDQVELGRSMLEKASNEGDASASVEYGILLYYGDPPRRKEALSYFQRAIDKGNRTALNNLAWAYCTSPEPAIIDVKRGLELTGALTRETAPLAHLDTAAACYASAGDFDRAAKIEKDILGKLESDEAGFKDDEFAKNLRERIKLYQQHQVYREHVEAKK
jgi:TPR repeat protein